MKSKPPKQSGPIARTDPAAPDGSGKRWWLHAVVVLGLLLGNLALYHPTVTLGFLSVDDPDYVQNNPLLENLRTSSLKRILTEPYFANYSPAHLLSYALDVALAGGKSARAIHWSNAVWNGWVVCMVYLLAFTLRATISTAAAAAFLFLLHPAHVEAVAWISCRKDLIATGFAALSMTCYLLHRRGLQHRGWWYAGSLFCFLLASAGKQSVLLLPLTMVVWDLLIEGRRSWRMVVDKIPFGLITIFFGWMTWHAQPSTITAWHAFVLATTQFTNLWLLSGLGDYVLYRSAPDPTAWSQVAQGSILLAAALVWALPLLLTKLRGPPLRNGSASGRRKARPVPMRPSSPERSGPARVTASDAIPVALCYWVLIQMVPPMLLNFMIPVTDRYLFLPSVAVCILLAGSAASLAARWPSARWIGWVMLTGLATVWGAKTSSYINEWRDPRTVWYGAHFRTKSSEVAQFLGEVYQNAGERIDDFLKSGASQQLTNDLDFARAVLGDEARATDLRQEWLSDTPAKTNSIAYRDRLWNLAREQFDQAVSHLGILSAPNLFMNRGRLLVRQGAPEQAIPEFQKALALAETSSYELVRQETVTHALFAIGVAHWNLHNYKEAQTWLLKAQEAQRKSARVWLPALDREVERIKTLAADRE